MMAAKPPATRLVAPLGRPHTPGPSAMMQGWGELRFCAGGAGAMSQRCPEGNRYHRTFRSLRSASSAVS
eukprot:scaffold3443_cov219-Pinguiococcus_pyrenoidosus.AAC.1